MTIQEKTRESEDDDPEIQPPKSDANQKREFPDPFYCKITNEVMKDPVVIPDGDSYERSAIEKRGDVPTDKIYSNRALKAIIDETMETSGSSIRAGMLRFHKSMRQSMNQLLDKSILPSAEYHPLSEEYYCPITFSLMHVPVIDPEGSTYEKVSIETWIKANGNSPLTRTVLRLDDLYPNNAIASLLDGEKAKGNESIHPSIRKWKEEAPPEVPDVEEPGNAQVVTSPTTQAEIDEAREATRRYNCSWSGFVFLAKVAWVLVACFFLIVVVVFGTFFYPFELFLLCLLCCCDFCYGRRSNEIDE